MSSNQIVSCQNPVYQVATSLEPYIKSPETYKRIFLVASVILSAISLVPGLRIPAAIAIRAISCISSGAMLIESVLDNKDYASRISLDVIKLAVVTCGFVGLLIGCPLVILTSLVVETAMQAFSCLKDFFYDQDDERITRGCIHLGLFVIGTLTLSALVTGAWPLIVVAAVVNVFIMGYFAFKISCSEVDSESDELIRIGKIFDAICYFALGGISIAGAFSSGEWNTPKRINETYHVKNESNENMHIILIDGEIVLSPGEERTFDTRARLGYLLKYYYDSTPSDKIAGKLAPIAIHDEIVHHAPIPVDQIATAPFGGAVLSNRETAYDSRPLKEKI